MKTLGERLKEALKGDTVANTSKCTGIKVVTIYRMIKVENCKPRADRVLSIADHLRVRMAWLIDGRLPEGGCNLAKSDKSYNRFYDRVKESLDGRTMRSLSIKLGLNPWALASNKHGHKIPGAQRALAIADALGVRVEWLLDGRLPRKKDEGDGKSNS